jgi:alkylation response protein AidB-like acyl-CoA dehydrogenase
MGVSKNFFLDNPDLRFQIESLPWEDIAPYIAPFPAEQDAIKSRGAELREQAKEFLTTLGEYIATQIAPYAKELDEQHPREDAGEVYDAPRMKKIVEGFGQLGAPALCLPAHCGGMDAPWLMVAIIMELLARADTSVATFFGFHDGPAHTLLTQALEDGEFEHEDGVLTKTPWDDIVRGIAERGEFGAMVLTEPGAGSDLAVIATKATLAADDTWRINGSKIWITCGHGEHLLVLARSEEKGASPGLKGLSLFYVPAHVTKDGKRVRNVELGTIEKKMGQSSLVTATLNFNDSEARLVGQRGHGFRLMLLFMNSARLAVGFEGIGICEAALRMAVDFAKERVTMGKPIIEHEMIADFIDDMESSIAAMRALAYRASIDEELASRISYFLKVKPPQNEKERMALEKKAKQKKRDARIKTPLVKYLGSEEGVRMTRLAMQIMGGVGYMKEYGAEKLLRDSLIGPIYEGTSQIQSLMVLKDHLQRAMRNPALFLAAHAKAKLETVHSLDSVHAAYARIKSIYFSAVQTILTQMVVDKFGDLKGQPLLHFKPAFLASWNPKKDFSFGLLHAERFTKIAAMRAASKELVRQADAKKGESEYAFRRQVAERYMNRSEPRMRGLLLEIEHTRTSIFRRPGQKKHTKHEAHANS